jgi:hypothetical protein
LYSAAILFTLSFEGPENSNLSFRTKSAEWGTPLFFRTSQSHQGTAEQAAEKLFFGGSELQLRHQESQQNGLQPLRNPFFLAEAQLSPNLFSRAISRVTPRASAPEESALSPRKTFLDLHTKALPPEPFFP